MNARGEPRVCIRCRHVTRREGRCPRCRRPLIRSPHGHRWRAPKRSDDRAWARIAAGEWLWDRRWIINRRNHSGWNPGPSMPVAR